MADYPWILKEVNKKTSEPLTDIFFFLKFTRLGKILEDLKAANMTMLFQRGQDRSKKIYILWEQQVEKSLTNSSCTVKKQEKIILI